MKDPDTITGHVVYKDLRAAYTSLLTGHEGVPPDEDHEYGLAFLTISRVRVHQYCRVRPFIMSVSQQRSTFQGAHSSCAPREVDARRQVRVYGPGQGADNARYIPKGVTDDCSTSRHGSIHKSALSVEEIPIEDALLAREDRVSNK